MSTQSDYIKEQENRCREEWFKEHKADFIGELRDGTVAIINWQKPHSWNYGCRFIIHRRWLCVVGDIGEAVFEWGQDVTLDFLAGLDFGYFLSKCQASPSGSKFEQWDGKIAWREASEYLSELRLKPKGDRGEHHDNELDALDQLQADGSSSREDYESAASDIYNATGDAETASMVSDWGKVPSVHAIGMFVGLQMALAQLKEAK